MAELNFETIVKYEFSKFKFPKNLNIYLDNLIDKKCFSVEVIIGDKMDLDPIGSIIFQYDYKNNKFYLSWLGVKGEHQNKGYGKSLCAAMENVAKNYCNIIETNTFVANPKYLKKLGFYKNGNKWVKLI